MMQANVCCLAPASLGRMLHQPFAAVISQSIGLNPWARKILARCEPIGEWHTTAQLNLNYSPTHKKPLICVGDAIATIDPVTGSGMALALQTGIWAAESIAHGLNSGQPYAEICQGYWQRIHRELGMRFRLLPWLRPFLFNPWLQEVAWPFMPPLLPYLARTFR